MTFKQAVITFVLIIIVFISMFLMLYSQLPGGLNLGLRVIGVVGIVCISWQAAIWVAAETIQDILKSWLIAVAAYKKTREDYEND